MNILVMLENNLKNWVNNAVILMNNFLLIVDNNLMVMIFDDKVMIKLEMMLNKLVKNQFLLNDLMVKKLQML
jgi:hypothetical protein